EALAVVELDLLDVALVVVAVLRVAARGHAEGLARELGLLDQPVVAPGELDVVRKDQRAAAARDGGLVAPLHRDAVLVLHGPLRGGAAVAFLDDELVAVEVCAVVPPVAELDRVLRVAVLGLHQGEAAAFIGEGDVELLAPGALVLEGGDATALPDELEAADEVAVGARLDLLEAAVVAVGHLLHGA